MASGFQHYWLALLLALINGHFIQGLPSISDSSADSLNSSAKRTITLDLNYATQSASLGRTYTMKCVARLARSEENSQSPPTIYWKVDNMNPQPPKFQVREDHSLIIHNVTKEDANHLYTCGTTYSESPTPGDETMNITLKVKYKARMVQGTQLDYLGILGEWANLTCAVNAEPPARFQWDFRNRVLTSRDDIKILYPEDNLSILQVLVRNESAFGPYVCNARNELGTMQENITIYKGQKPAITVLETDVVGSEQETTRNPITFQNLVIIPKEKNVTRFINESYFVSCQPPDGQRADWYNPQRQKIDGNEQNRIHVEASFGVDLYLTRITPQDSGTYTCITNRGVRSSFHLNVLRRIIFDLDHATQSASEGKTYTLKCAASGQNPPKIYWKVDNKNPQSPKYRVTKENYLLIQNVTLEDAKKSYVCRAMDMESSAPDSKYMNITLKVKTKPRMVRGARLEHWGVLGEWANLTCAVNAEPPATIEWVSRNRTLTSNDEYLILYPHENTSILQVLVRNEAKFGQYDCKARNDQGQMEKSMLLHKGQKPATPVLEIDIIAYDGARIRIREFRQPSNLTVQDGSRRGKALPITGYVVQYKMMTRKDWERANSTKYDEGFVIRDLQPGITFQVRAASKNQASVGEYSQPITIITSQKKSWSILGGEDSLEPSISFCKYWLNYCQGPAKESALSKYACQIVNIMKAMVV